jgi:hypothetical protein
MRITSVLGAALLLLAAASQASADSIKLFASGQGWCNSTGECNNNARLNNTFAGVQRGGNEFRNWFRFDLPGGDIESAVLNIWNDGGNFTTLPSARYDVRNAADLSFEGLRGSTTLGSIGVGAADTGESHFVAIAMNAEGLGFLNASAGRRFLFGGIVSPFVSDSEIQTFGYTTGPPSAFLQLSGDFSPTPEPVTSLVGMCAAVAVMVVRRRRLPA